MAPSIWQLLILVAVIVLLFGTKKLRSLGSDLGESIKGFKKAINEDDSINKNNSTTSTIENQNQNTDNTDKKE